jgi:GT2 family glycosyltransferase
VADAVEVCFIYDDEHRAAPNTFISWGALFATSFQVGRPLVQKFKLAKGYDVAKARNEAVEDFLAGDVPWLLFVDLDMGFDPDALERLLAVADPETRPIVGGLCFGYSPSDDRMADANGVMRYPFPTIYDLARNGESIGFRVRYGYRSNALQQCFATGAAFLLIHRSALERMRDEKGQTWFARMQQPGGTTWWGEDVSFCARAAMCGIELWVDTRVRTSHWKPVYVSESFYMAQLQAPPADELVDVVVPVLGRPHHAEPFMRSLRASTGLASVWAMLNADEDDEVEKAWAEAGAEVVRCAPGRTTFAHKANDALGVTSAPWLLVVGSDVQFRAGWWDHALQAAKVHDASVVATNDLLNADVRDGLLATHPVFRRSYIDAVGGSWDGPGRVAHEGYKHWWVDAEWSLAARQRGVYVNALASIVEHLHPHVGKSQMDAVYELGQKFKNLDRETFERRARRYAKAAA